MIAHELQLITNSNLSTIVKPAYLELQGRGPGHVVRDTEDKQSCEHTFILKDNLEYPINITVGVHVMKPPLQNRLEFKPKLFSCKAS